MQQQLQKEGYEFKSKRSYIGGFPSRKGNLKCSNYIKISKIGEIKRHRSIKIMEKGLIACVSTMLQLLLQGQREDVKDFIS